MPEIRADRVLTLKLGIEISQATWPSTWCEDEVPLLRPGAAFLLSDSAGIAAIDMFVVASVSFWLLYVMSILAHDRRRIIHTAAAAREF